MTNRITSHPEFFPTLLPHALEARKPGFVIAPTLQRFLTKTQQGDVMWRYQSQKQGADQFDVLTSENAGIRIELKGLRPAQKANRFPSAIRDWEVTIHQPKTGMEKSLNGKICYLPTSLSSSTDPSQETIPKLFRAAYEARGKEHGELLPLFSDLTEKLRDGRIEATSTFIKPNPLYGPPTGVKLLQIGSQEPRLEVAKMGHNLRFTLHHEGRVKKLTEQLLENDAMYQVLDGLIAEAVFQQTGKAGKGLEAF